MNGRARLAWNVRRLRTARGITQEQLAVDARVAAPYLSRIENGSVNPTIDVLDRLAGVLAVGVDELLRSPTEGSPPIETLKAGRKRQKADWSA